MIPVALLRRKAAFTNAAKLPAVVTLPVMHGFNNSVSIDRAVRFIADHRRCRPRFRGLKPIWPIDPH